MKTITKPMECSTIIATPVSFVIPVYNEEEIIDDAIENLYKYLGQNKIQAEVILVDNHSIDSTQKKILDLQKNHSNLILLNSKKGIGNALKAGFEHANEDIIMFTSLDFPFGMANIANSYRGLASSDLVIGSKGHPDSIIRNTLKRRIISFFFRILLKVLLGLKVRDPQGSLMFRKSITNRVLPYCCDGNAFFETQFVLYAQMLGYSILEIPVTYTNVRNNTRFNLWKECLKVVRSIFAESLLYRRNRNRLIAKLSAEERQKRAYDITSEIYEDKMKLTFTGKINQIVREVSIKLLNPQREDHILDVGAGDGSIAIMAAEKGAKLKAFDISPKMVELGKRLVEKSNLNIEFYSGDAQDIREAERSFDKILCINVIHRLPQPERCLSGANSVLKQGGRLVIFTMNYYSPQFMLIVFYCCLRDMIGFPLLDTVAKSGFTPKGIRQMVEQNGFIVDKIQSEVFTFPYFNIRCPEMINSLLRLCDRTLKRLPIIKHMGVFIAVVARKS